MTPQTIRVAGIVLVSLLAAVTARASGDGSPPIPAAAQETAEQMSDQYYNEGLASRDRARELEKQLATAADADRSKLESRIAKHYKRAIVSYRDALKINPNHYRASASLGHALLETGSYDEAIAACDRALEIEPGYTEAIESRGEACLGLNRIDDAKEAYMQLLGSDRAKAGELLEAMERWVGESPEGVDPATLAAFSSWIDERSGTAGDTTPVSQLRGKH